MKGTEHFKNTIQLYLESRASYDELFAVSYAKPHKNLDHCITYIIDQVYKSGCNGFVPEEIHSLAVHYYDEDTIEVGKPRDCKVVVDHHIELTQEEQEQARKDAVKRFESEAYAKMKQQQEKALAKRTATTTQSQATLFDF